MRRPISPKPNTCTEGVVVNAAGISVKVARLTLGDLLVCLVLPPSRGDGMSRQKSAEGIVDPLRPGRRPEREVYDRSLNFDVKGDADKKG